MSFMLHMTIADIPAHHTVTLVCNFRDFTKASLSHRHSAGGWRECRRMKAETDMDGYKPYRTCLVPADSLKEYPLTSLRLKILYLV